MQDDETHAVEDPRVDPLDDRLGHLVMGHVPPPGQDIGAGEDLVREALVGLIEGRGPDLEPAVFLETE